MRTLLMLRHFVRWHEHSAGRFFDLTAVDPRDIVEYRCYLLQRGRRPATVNRRLSALKQLFVWAERNGRINHSPFEILENVSVREQKDISPKWLKHSEQMALIRAARQSGSQRDLAIVQTLLGTGLRLSELVELKLTDVSIGERSGRIWVRQGKGGKARDIPLDNRTRHVIVFYLAVRIEDGSERLFLGQRGPLNSDCVYHLIKKFAYQARLEDVTPHTLRRCFGKNLVDVNVPLDQVATLLGHESLDTVRIYTRPSQEDLERAVRKAGGEVLT